jgi:amicyanin
MTKTTIIISIVVVLVIILGIIIFVMSGIGYTQKSPILAKTNDKSANTPTSLNPTGKIYNIDISNFKFIQPSISIKKGDTIIWTNKDSAPHTVTSDSGSELNSATLSTGQTYSHTFNAIGTYNYHCTIHTVMKANIIVE